MVSLLAQLRNPVLPKEIGGGNPPTAVGGDATGLLVTRVMEGMFIFAFLIALIYLITGAIHWITSGGDKVGLEHARNKIIHAIVGLIVVASVFAVMTLVGQFLGLKFDKLPIPTIPSTTTSPATIPDGQPRW